MLLGFETENEIKAKAAYIIYVIYKSRDVKRGPSGLDMWGQVERFAKASAKRSVSVDDFVNTFKRKMACATINPRWMKTDTPSANARIMSNNEIIVMNNADTRTFGLDIFNDEESGKEIVECIYKKTQIIILLVRDRLEREKMFAQEEKEDEN